MEPRVSGTWKPQRGAVAGVAVAADAARRLQASPYAAIRAISIEFHLGALVLRGQVACYFHKQMAQETVRRVAGVEFVLNAVEVIDGSYARPVSNTDNSRQLCHSGGPSNGGIEPRT